MFEKANDGYNLLTHLEVVPGLANSRQLKIKWRWSSDSQAEVLLQQAKIFYYNDVDIEFSGTNIISDPEVTEFLLEDLRPDTKYTICLHITRRKFGSTSYSNRIANHPQIRTSQPIPSVNSPSQVLHSYPNLRFGTTFAGYSPKTTNEFVTEMECQVAFTRLIHWPAFICSGIGILLAFLISLTIYFIFKSQKSKQNSTDKNRTNLFCKIHNRQLIMNSKNSADSHTNLNKHSHCSVHDHFVPKHRTSVLIDHTPSDISGLRKPCLKSDKLRPTTNPSPICAITASESKPTPLDKRKTSDHLEKESNQLNSSDMIQMKCSSTIYRQNSSTTSLVESHQADDRHGSFTSTNSPTPLILSSSELNESGRDQTMLEKWGNFKRTVSFVDQTSHLTTTTTTTTTTTNQSTKKPNQFENKLGNEFVDQHPNHNLELPYSISSHCDRSLISKQIDDELNLDENSPAPESVQQSDFIWLENSKPITCQDHHGLGDSQVLSPLLRETDLVQLSSTQLTLPTMNKSNAHDQDCLQLDVSNKSQGQLSTVTTEPYTTNFIGPQLESLYMPRTGHDFIDQSENSSIFHTQLIETL